MILRLVVLQVKIQGKMALTIKNMKSVQFQKRKIQKNVLKI